MALWAYALFSLAEAKRFLPVDGDSQDLDIVDAVNEASRMIEDAWGRQLISRGTLTEYHPRDWTSCRPLGRDLRPNEYPLVAVSAVYEAGTLLTVTTEYVAVKEPVSLVRRLVDGVPVSWPYNTASSTGMYRVIDLRYIAGFRRHDDATDTATTPPVAPESVRRVGRELVAWIFHQRQKHEVGRQAVSDALGNRTFTGPAYITPAMQSALNEAGGCGGMGRHYLTGERDS